MMDEEKENGNTANFGARADEPSEEDELGFESYVEAVKEFITSSSTEPPLTISIEGEWGSGKSSFMQQLRSSLDEEDQITVEFNPWKHEKQEAVWAAFALKFISDIQNGSGRCNKLRNKLKLRLKRYINNRSRWSQIKTAFTVVAFTVPAIALILLWLKFGSTIVIEALGFTEQEFGNWKLLLQSAGVLAGLLSYMRIWNRLRSDFTGSLEQNLVEYAQDPGYADKIGFVDSFHEDFKHILDVYVEEDQRVFVFIDDLDRCSVPRAANLMQAINLILTNDDRLVFILGLDRARVAAGMAAKHEDLLDILDEKPAEEPSKLGFGYQYLEKFIQIPFLVPEPKEEEIRGLMIGDTESDDFDKDISEHWDEILEEYEDNLEQIVDMVVPALGSNPRQVKRFMNLYQLRAVLAHIEGVLEVGDSPSSDKVTLPQLAKFVIISIQWPQLISKIYNDPTALDRLLDWKEGKEEDITGIEPWVSDPDLLDLLNYGESEDYDLRRIDLGKLMKISPRVDIPADSERGLGPMERSIQISCFTNDERPNIDLESDIVPHTSNIDVRVYDHHPSDSRPTLSKALHSYIWIIDPEMRNSNSFEELYDSAPNETMMVFWGEESPPEAIDERYEDAVYIKSISSLKNILHNSVQKIADPEEKGDMPWKQWRSKATKSRDDYLHGF